MKATSYLLTLAMLALLLFTACDQPQDTKTAKGPALPERTEALQTSSLLEQPASSISKNAGSTELTRAPARSLLDNVASNSDLTTFNALLRKAGVARSLSGTGPYTVFAPTEAAFMALPDSVRSILENSGNNELVQQLLNNHIIAGKLTTSDLQDGAILKTAAGRQLQVGKGEKEVQIGQALVEEPDGLCKNGVLHTIDKVLVPVEETVL